MKVPPKFSLECPNRSRHVGKVLGIFIDTENVRLFQLSETPLDAGRRAQLRPYNSSHIFDVAEAFNFPNRSGTGAGENVRDASPYRGRLEPYRDAVAL